MIIISTVNIGLKFGAEGVPTLREIETLLKSIKSEAGKGIKINVNYKELKSDADSVNKEIKEQKDLLRLINLEIATAEQKYKRQVITGNDLNKVYKNAISYLKQMEGQELRLEQIKTKKYNMEKMFAVEITKQQTESENIQRKVMDNLHKEALALNKIYDIQKKINNARMDKLHSQALLENDKRNTMIATGYTSINKNKTTTRRNTEENNYLNAPYQNIMYGMAGIGLFRNYMQFSLGLEKAIYDLGVVSGESNVKLSQMYTTFLAMSQEMPIGAQRLTENITEIARVGFDLEKSIAIGTAGAKFAIASGDKIEGVTDSLAKVLLALDLTKVTEQEVTRITDEMQSVLLKTPLSTQTLSEGMRHASSAMAVFTQNSQRTGDDLENYKKEILTTTLALEGSFSRIGRTGSKDLLPLLAIAS